ncbi:WD_REPEATS_REGION domain-containing protein [Caenorhabditis elegans]|uniref:WD_REPEATS_REGION domain-containing protein n=1 Tax=Caenorhabditis elegans TaxID=6239 RepID=Q22059_CAEEL|nr:WD_REPEATS_REGION domain-containing protein [Caenorhabditis elegans]CAB01663.2 WD_REPEATS_REGION domain-containing protein [Caenorhabditis elegans]|eukprot:NP_506685.2 CDT (S. pombe CDC10 Dependent Transcript) homolog [Caenorhabditis elegans]
MDFLHSTKARKRYLRYPSSIYEELESKHYSMPAGETDDHDTWVTARFSPHLNQEHILYMGDDPGNIGIFDVRKFQDRSVPLEERQLYFFPAHDGAIMDVVGVPQKESQIVSISGDSTIRCWDLNQSTLDRKSQVFFGHEGSVRSICFAPDDPNVFVTGGRDFQVKIWDMRVSTVKKMEEDCRMATITYKTAHPKPSKVLTSGTPKSKAKAKTIEGYKVTSVLFLDEHHVASASENADSGIRVWDIRKPTRNGEGQPARILKVPTSNKKSYGVTCLTLDRFGNRLFASCTDSSIFEYSVPSESVSPINSYTGATIHNFYTQVACSPVSDVIACGSEDSRAVVWDLQDQYNYMNDRKLPDDIDKRRTKLPRFSCDGHLKQVLNVGWSSRGTYFMSCDEGGVRIWSEPRNRCTWKLNDEDDTSYPTTSQELGLSYEKIKKFELKESDEAMSCFDSISLSPRQRADSSGLSGSPQKNRGSKRPIFESPLKSICTNSPKPLRLNRSPRAKMSKLSFSPPSPLQPTNSNNQDLVGYRTPRQIRNKKKKNNPFYNEHPTEGLPNFVYDTFVKKLIGESSKSDIEDSGKSLSKTGQKRIEDWWQTKGENVATVTRARLPSVSEFGESACSKVITEDERIALHSPRKLVLKSSSTQSPCPSNSKPKPIPMTPRKPMDKRPTSRNLLHYFKK